MSRRRLLALVAAGVAVALTVVAVAVAQDQLDLPDFLKADDQRPVMTPTAGQQVLVLEVDLSADGDKVSGRVRSQNVVDNFAPKSVARSGGDWEVRVSGEKALTYAIPNPLTDVEIERLDDDKRPLQGAELQTLDWTLVVPLYADGQPLGATSVEVVDLLTGAVILKVDVPTRP
jgi:hypothetical protein